MGKDIAWDGLKSVKKFNFKNATLTIYNTGFTLWLAKKGEQQQKVAIDGSLFFEGGEIIVKTGKFSPIKKKSAKNVKPEVSSKKGKKELIEEEESEEDSESDEDA